jgi:hypothetical protein
MWQRKPTKQKKKPEICEEVEAKINKVTKCDKLDGAERHSLIAPRGNFSRPNLHHLSINTHTDTEITQIKLD